MATQVMCENSNSVSKFLLLTIFQHSFKQDNNQINIYKRFAKKQIDIFYHSAEMSCKKIKESTINMFFLFSSAFYQYLKIN